MSIIFLKVHQKRKPMMCLTPWHCVINKRTGDQERDTTLNLLIFREDNSRHVLETDDLLFLFFCPLLHKIIKYISINILYSHSLYPSFSFQAADEMALKDDTSSAFPLLLFAILNKVGKNIVLLTHNISTTVYRKCLIQKELNH